MLEDGKINIPKQRPILSIFLVILVELLWRFQIWTIISNGGENVSKKSGEERLFSRNFDISGTTIDFMISPKQCLY